MQRLKYGYHKNDVFVFVFRNVVFVFSLFVLSDCQLTTGRTTGVFTRVSFYFSNLTAI